MSQPGFVVVGGLLLVGCCSSVVGELHTRFTTIDFSALRVSDGV